MTTLKQRLDHLLARQVPFVDREGCATRELLEFFRDLWSGVVQRTAYPYAVISRMTPKRGHMVICQDSSVVTRGSVLAGGGSTIVQAIGDGTNWRLG